jgi:type III pantothenate kinase
MLLAVDVGNSHTVLGLYEDGRLVRSFRIASHAGRTTDEYHTLWLNLFSAAGIRGDQVHGSILACVVPALTDVIVEVSQRMFGHTMLVVTPTTDTGVRIACDEPREVGADILVNVVAAYERVRGESQGVIVVDFGTATTFDCVSPRGEYLGSSIAPGLQISADALFSRTAQLPRIAIQKPPTAIGTTTVRCMQSGIFFGYVGLVDGLVRRIQDELAFPCKVIATGGLASLIQPESKTIDAIDEHLTLDGLRLVYERNVTRAV